MKDGAQGSVACSVTVVTGRTPCAVRDAHSSFVAKTDIREKATVQVVCFANGRPVPARRDSHHTQMLRIHLFLSHTALCASVIAYEIKNNLKVLFRLCVVDGQDSLISGAEMLAFESGACSVTVVTGRTPCAVRNAPSSLLQTPTVKEKVQQYKPFAKQTTVLFLRMNLVPHANATHYLVFCFPLRFVQAQSSGKQKTT